MPSTVKREGLHCKKQEGGLPEEHHVVRVVFLSSIERGGVHRRVSKGEGCVIPSSGKTVGGLSLWETDPSLSLASTGPRDRGHFGRRIRLDRSRLRFPKHYKKRQGAPDGSTLTGRARHPPYRRGAFVVRLHQCIISTARAAWGVRSSDHHVTTRLGKGARKLAPRAWLRLSPVGDACHPPVRWPPVRRRGPKKNPSLRTYQDEGRS